MYLQDANIPVEIVVQSFQLEKCNKHQSVKINDNNCDFMVEKPMRLTVSNCVEVFWSLGYQYSLGDVYSETEDGTCTVTYNDSDLEM